MKTTLKHLFGVFVVALASGCLALTPEECFGGSDHAPYIAWVSEQGSSYSAAVCFNSVSSDTSQGVALHWRVDEENVYIAVAARATGWVGLGLAETGGMKGADMVLFETANPGQVRDAHVLDELLPITDDCQDWIFVNSRSEGGFIIFEGYRKQQTLDTQDHEIINDIDSIIESQRLIAAWGDSSTASYHGANRAKGSIRWYGGGDEMTLVHERLEMTADGYFDLLVPNYTLKAIETDIVTFCFSWDSDIAVQGVPTNSSITVFAAMVISRNDTRKFVHHATMFGSTMPSNESRACLPYAEYIFPVYAWTQGVFPLVLPDYVGFTMGPGHGVQSFRFEIHYNNPELIENVVDTSGVRVFYSLTPREHELGVLNMGDSLVALRGNYVPPGVSEFEFVCDTTCSSFALTEPVTVIQEGIHMHTNGAAAALFQIRDGEVIRESHVDFFDFDQTGT
jgi:DOMON domain/Copper type II ascorbate-dependent monooxygenase, N-terminal domain